MFTVDYRKRFSAHVAMASIAAIAMVSLARLVPAQPTPSVAGAVTDNRGKPVSGALIVALDGAGQLAARGLSGRNGAFEFPLPASRPLFLVSLRVGYESSSAQSITTPSTSALALVVSSVPTRISNDKARQKSVCGEPRDTASDVTNLWGEARKALASSRLLFGGDELTATLTRYDRNVSRDGKTVLSGTSTDGEVSARRPYNSLPPESIARAGYVIEDQNDVAYYAPDAEVLLSTAFAESHCFGMQAPQSTHPTWIGLTFKPKDERVGVKEIAGTFWFDRASLELRSIDYRYTNVPLAYAAANVGGDIGFAHLANGAWLLNRWEIRMPQGEVLKGIKLQHSQSRNETHVTVESLRTAGGVLKSVTIGTEVFPIPTP